MTVAESLDCGSCRQPFDLGPRRPKVLPCGHTCCRGCLLERDRWHSRTGYFRCPENNKVYVGNADYLLDNSYLISAIEHDPRSGGTSTRFPVLLERSALPRLLEELAALPELKSEALASLRRTIRVAQLEQLQVLQRLERLRRASGAADWQRLRKDAQRLLDSGQPQKQELQRDLRLLRGRRLAARPALELRGAGSLSAAADAELQLEEQPALRLAATRLREQGDLPHVQYQEKKKEWRFYELPWIIFSRSRWLPKAEDRRKLEGESLKISEGSVKCLSADPCWWESRQTLPLLQRYSSIMTCLRLSHAGLEHLAALWEFTALQELEVTLFGMASRATETRDGQPLQWPPLGPSKARRLWRARLHMPWSVSAVLLAAHRDSLLHVTMTPIRTRPTWDQADAIAGVLRECDLHRLCSFELRAELAGEEAEVLRAALPGACRLQHEVRVGMRRPPKPVYSTERVEPAPQPQPASDEQLEEDNDVDIGLGLFD